MNKRILEIAKQAGFGLHRDGVDYWIYAVEFEPGERERSVYDETRIQQVRLTGEFF